MSFNQQNVFNYPQHSSHLYAPGQMPQFAQQQQQSQPFQNIPSVFSDQDEADFDEYGAERAHMSRKRIEPEKTRILMRVFEVNQKPDTETRMALAQQLEMTPRSVQIWFQNRRAKLKREINQQMHQRMRNQRTVNTAPESWNNNFPSTAFPQFPVVPANLQQPIMPSSSYPQADRMLPPPSTNFNGYSHNQNQIPVINIMPDSSPESTTTYSEPDTRRFSALPSLFGVDEIVTLPTVNQKPTVFAGAGHDILASGFAGSGHDFLLSNNSQQNSLPQPQDVRKVKSLSNMNAMDEDETSLKRRRSMDLLALVDLL